VAASAAIKLLDARISHDHLINLSIVFAIIALMLLVGSTARIAAFLSSLRVVRVGRKIE
jgi:hypothetical protein